MLIKSIHIGTYVYSKSNYCNYFSLQNHVARHTKKTKQKKIEHKNNTKFSSKTLKFPTHKICIANYRIYWLCIQQMFHVIGSSWFAWWPVDCEKNGDYHSYISNLFARWLHIENEGLLYIFPLYISTYSVFSMVLIARDCVLKCVCQANIYLNELGIWLQN